MKTDHEVWVSKQLSDDVHPEPVRIKTIKQNIPEFLVRLTTGKELIDHIFNASMGSKVDRGSEWVPVLRICPI
jgi:hypothetical protein